MPLTTNTNIRAQDGIDDTLNVPLGREDIRPRRPAGNIPLDLPTNPVVAAAKPSSPSVEPTISGARSIWSMSFYALILVAVAALAWFKFS